MNNPSSMLKSDTPHFESHQYPPLVTVTNVDWHCRTVSTSQGENSPSLDSVTLPIPQENRTLLSELGASPTIFVPPKRVLLPK